MAQIEMDSLTKTFKRDFSKKKVEALKALTLSVDAGQVFGFLGPNGAAEEYDD